MLGFLFRYVSTPWVILSVGFLVTLTFGACSLRPHWDSGGEEKDAKAAILRLLAEEQQRSSLWFELWISERLRLWSVAESCLSPPDLEALRVKLKNESSALSLEPKQPTP